MKAKESWRGLECPRHLCLFNPHSLQYLFEQTGFSRISIRTRNAPSDLVDTIALERKIHIKSFLRKVPYISLIPWIILSIIHDQRKGGLLEASANF
jgi:hypothetical protein